jgi:hypothetical protein
MGMLSFSEIAKLVAMHAIVSRGDDPSAKEIDDRATRIACAMELRRITSVVSGQSHAVTDNDVRMQKFYARLSSRAKRIVNQSGVSPDVESLKNTNEVFWLELRACGKLTAKEIHEAIQAM